MRRSIKKQFEELKKQARSTAIELKESGMTMEAIGAMMSGSNVSTARIARTRALIDKSTIGDPEKFLENVKKIKG